MGIIVGELYKDLDLISNKVESTKSPIAQKAYDICVKADALRISNQLNESVEEYLKSILIDNKSIQTFTGLGLSYKALGRYEEAINAFEKAKELNPFDKKTRFYLGTCHVKNNCLCKARKEFTRAIRLDKKFIEPQFDLAVVHEMLNENDMAFDIYKQIIAKRPSYIPAYNNIGSLHMRLTEYKEAISYFKKVININPDFSKAYLGIAVSFDKLEEFSQAIKYYKRYLELKPYSANSEYVKTRIENASLERKENRSKNHLKLVVNN